MTLSSFLNPGSSYGKSPINERGEHVHYSGSWKGGGGSKGGKVSQSAISALTLLAFLFFLNILQTCLKDQLQAQSPLTIMMTTQTTSTTTEAQRHRREVGEEKERGDTGRKKSEERGTKGSDEYELTALKESHQQKTSAKDVFLSPEASEPPWLHHVICCKILSCRQSEEKITYSNYLRKIVYFFCYSTKSKMKKRCSYCPLFPLDTNH